MTELNARYMTPTMIGSLCQQLYPDAENEIEAVDMYSKYVYDLVQLKIKSNIAAAEDIITFLTLCQVRRQLIEAQYKQAVNNYDTNRNRD